MKKSIHIKKEIRVVGLRRTGNHAIINWIVNQQKGKKLFINDTPTLASPYRNNYQPPDDGYLDTLIYSHEDRRLNYVGNPYFEKRHDTFVGKSKKRFDVLILRDPFNLFASRYHSDRTRVYANSLSVPDMWIMYAREYLGITNFLKHNKVLINYNKWCTDFLYRKKLAEQLELEFTDEGFEKVSIVGKGSSFDGIEYNNKASKMKVLERWKSFQNDENYIKYFQDKIIIDLSDKIFERPKDIDEFINKKIIPNYAFWAFLRRKFIDLSVYPAELAIHVRIRLGLTTN